MIDDDSLAGTRNGIARPPARQFGAVLRAGAQVTPRRNLQPANNNRDQVNNNNNHSPPKANDLTPVTDADGPKINAALRSGRSQAKSIREREQYEKLKEIGRGAFGIVYIGRHVRTGELVAIKEMEVHVAEELRTEFEIMQHLHHENIVTVKGFEAGKRHARLYLEWVAGGSLAEILRHRNINDEGLLASYVRQILNGLSYLHEHDVLHRDIKPRNILVDHKGGLKLTDFGLSRHLESMQDKTKCAGTPIYMSPEVMNGHFSVGSDIWALGATMSEMVTGKLPWSHIDPAIFASPVALMVHIHKYQGDPSHHPVIPSDLSPQCRDFMQRCFSPNPKDRGTCRELLEHPFLREENIEEGFPAALTSCKSRSKVSTEKSTAEGTGEASDSSSFDENSSFGDPVHRTNGNTPAAPNTATAFVTPPLLSESQRGAGPDAYTLTTPASVSEGEGKERSPSHDSGTPGPVAGSVGGGRTDPTCSLASEVPK